MPITTNTFNVSEVVSVFPDEQKAMAVVLAANLTLAAGTVMAQNSSTGLWVAYVNGGANGTGTARGILQKAVRTDANGRVTFGDQTPGEWGQVYTSAPVCYKGVFRRGDLTGLDATAIGQLGRMITGGTVAAEDLLFVN